MNIRWRLFQNFNTFEIYRHFLFFHVTFWCYEFITIPIVKKSWNQITRSSDSFSTVLPKVNEVDWGCIVRDLETIIVLVLLAFNFTPQGLHHALALTRSRLRDSATVTLTYRDGKQLSKWGHRQKRSAYLQNVKMFEVYRRNNNGPKTTVAPLTRR